MNRSPIEFISLTGLEPAFGRLGFPVGPVIRFFDPLRRYLPAAGIALNRERLCHFLAQVCHETGGFQWLEELSDGKYLENRGDLGNIQAGDGTRYKGRGLIQLTGRWNYGYYGGLLGTDLIRKPELAAEPDIAVRIACCFWNKNDLSHLADQGDFEAITRKINGGTSNLQDRWKWLNALMTEYDIFMAIWQKPRKGG